MSWLRKWAGEMMVAGSQVEWMRRREDRLVSGRFARPRVGSLLPDPLHTHQDQLQAVIEADKARTASSSQHLLEWQDGSADV